MMRNQKFGAASMLYKHNIPLDREEKYILYAGYKNATSES